jgi:hypothetical protein
MPVERHEHELLGLQRKDGGWAQTPWLSSDAYATGQVLYALHEAGMPASHEAYGRGVQYLARIQQNDGSWHVSSRAPKFQPFFQSGFPYDDDQWISSARRRPGQLWACPTPYPRRTSRTRASRVCGQVATALRVTLRLAAGLTVRSYGFPICFVGLFHIGYHLPACLAVQWKLDHLSQRVLPVYRGAHISREPVRETRQYCLEE